MKTLFACAFALAVTTATIGWATPAAAEEPFELNATQMDAVTGGIALLLPAVQAARDAARDNADAALVLEPHDEFLLLTAGPDLDLSPPGLPAFPRQ